MIFLIRILFVSPMKQGGQVYMQQELYVHHKIFVAVWKMQPVQCLKPFNVLLLQKEVNQFTQGLEIYHILICIWKDAQTVKDVQKNAHSDLMMKQKPELPCPTIIVAGAVEFVLEHVRKES